MEFGSSHIYLVRQSDEPSLGGAAATVASSLQQESTAIELDKYVLSYIKMLEL